MQVSIITAYLCSIHIPISYHPAPLPLVYAASHRLSIFPSIRKITLLCLISLTGLSLRMCPFQSELLSAHWCITDFQPLLYRIRVPHSSTGAGSLYPSARFCSAVRDQEVLSPYGYVQLALLPRICLLTLSYILPFPFDLLAPQRLGRLATFRLFHSSFANRYRGKSTFFYVCF